MARENMISRLSVAAIIAMSVAIGGCGAGQAPESSAYVEEIAAWRAAREARLKGDGGWLSVAGLYWLEEGENGIGADPGNQIVLPEGAAPPFVGVLTLHDGSMSFEAKPGVTVIVEGEPVTRREIRPDSSGSPDVLEVGDLTMYVIHRGDRYGIRLKDPNSRMRREFTGLTWFDVSSDYRITARWEPYDPPKEIAVPNILGSVEAMPCPGAAVFSLGGREVRLEPVLEDPEADELFFIFKDATSGNGTYPPGRFLYAALPKEGTIVLDFNKAYNPPCAFTPYATCPLPPAENTLAVRIEAGEKNYGGH